MIPFDDLDLSWLRSKPGVKWRWAVPDVLAAWVADMDFPVPPPVRTALEEVLARGDLGYPEWLADSPLAEPFAERMLERFGWRPEPGRVREVTDIIQGVQVVLHLATVEGDGVALHVPSYPPFLDTVRRMGRRLVASPIEREPGGWTFDADRLADDVRREHCRVLLLVNPHNPTGRVLTRAELEVLARITVEHDLLVIADEVHADLVYAPHRHIPFASLSPEAARRTVTLTSATKAFNLAGIRCALAHVGSDQVLAAWRRCPPHLFGVVGVLGVEATLAAWRHGSAWLDDVREHLAGNRELLADLVRAELPGVALDPPEATYLAWLDFRALALGADPAGFLLDRARVWLSPGPAFGLGGDGFARLNFATSRPLLRAMLGRIGAAVRSPQGPR